MTPIEQVASTVGNGYYDGGITILTSVLPYLIPICLLFLAFYFIFNKATKVVGMPTSFHKIVSVPGVSEFKGRKGSYIHVDF